MHIHIYTDRYIPFRRTRKTAMVEARSESAISPTLKIAMAGQ